jgi:hypothetical protein
MSMIKLYKQAIVVMEKVFVILESTIEKPKFVQRGSYQVFRYETNSIKAAVIQKSARLISGLNASLILLEHGFVQELGVIFRTIDEFLEDVLFLCEAIRNNEITALHKEFLEYFYMEEFDQPDNPLLSEQKRPSIPRKKILAAISNIKENDLNPSDSQELFRTINKVFSGYVHGASNHILEMYCGNPPKFYLSGMLETPSFREILEACWDYIYRGLISIMMVALSFGQNELIKELYEFRDYFEAESGKTHWEHPEKLIKNLKKKF